MKAELADHALRGRTSCRITRQTAKSGVFPGVDPDSRTYYPTSPQMIARIPQMRTSKSVIGGFGKIVPRIMTLLGNCFSGQ